MRPTCWAQTTEEENATLPKDHRPSMEGETVTPWWLFPPKRKAPFFWPDYGASRSPHLNVKTATLDISMPPRSQSSQ